MQYVFTQVKMCFDGSTNKNYQGDSHSCNLHGNRVKWVAKFHDAEVGDADSDLKIQTGVAICAKMPMLAWKNKSAALKDANAEVLRTKYTCGCRRELGDNAGAAEPGKCSALNQVQ